MSSIGTLVLRLASITMCLAVALPAIAGIPDPGDANCDGEIKHEDIRILVGAFFAETEPPCAGRDVNEDGRLSAADLPAVLQPVTDHATTSIAVFIMGDGMGPEHVRAGEVFAGRPMSFAAFPVVVDGFDTGSLDTEATGAPTDSAAGATAFVTGHRVFNGEISRTGGMDLVNAGELARGAGKSVGIVTNSYLFDASPATVVSHADSRAQAARIADQYLAMAPDVLIGGAPRPDDFPDLEGFIERARQRGYTVVRTASELEALDLGEVRKLLALFDADFDIGVPPFVRILFPLFGTPRIFRTENTIDPPLERSAEIALDILSRNRFGFFLFIENENTDTLSHQGQFATQTIEPLGTIVAGEVVDISDATDAVMGHLQNVGRSEDALVLVTADHECGGFTFDDDPAAGTFPAAPNHTNTPVPLYATGPGSERFTDITVNTQIFDALRPSLR